MALPNAETANHEKKTQARTPVSAEHRRRAQMLRDAQGLYVAANRLGVGADTLARILAGEPVLPGTRALVAAKIAERDAAGKVP